MKYPTMLDQIIEAMNLLGGHCYYKDLYEKILELYPNVIDSYKDVKGWRCAVRTVILRASSDSISYQGTNDLFYSIEGLGQGHWGLRNPNISEKTMDFTTDDEGFVEGKESLKKHVLRERNHSLKIEAIKNFKKKHDNQIFCEICNFNFEKKYGKIGKDFIEIHHSKPISEMKENERTKLEDIVLICSNRHSMIHRRRPWLTKEDIKKLI